jgi:hypothetical protein
VGRRPFIPDSTLNRRSVALYVTKPTQFGYPQETAECQNYLKQGRSTIPEIGAKYSPPGAANDPKHTNAHGVPSA